MLSDVDGTDDGTDGQMTDDDDDGTYDGTDVRTEDDDGDGTDTTARTDEKYEASNTTLGASFCCQSISIHL